MLGTHGLSLAKIMKQHYEKVKHMSLALQKKEETRANLMNRIQESDAKAGLKEAPIVSSSLLGGVPVVYAVAAVYCTVLFCVVSTICKIY